MDSVQLAQDTLSATLGTLIGGLLLAVLAWLVWPLRWQIQGRAIKRLIADERHFNFVFNPSSKISKEVTFLVDGKIGQGRNDNEHSWRIRKGALEIIASDGRVYSRFKHDRSQGTLKHTNDPELRSIPGQYFEPRLVKVSRGAA